MSAGSQIEGFVPYAILRTRNLVGELQDFVDAHPPGVREAPALPTPRNIPGPGHRECGGLQETPGEKKEEPI